jgi:hypothetical protein
MKKILSFVLVLAMIASMMCVSVSAAANSSYPDNDFIGNNATNNGKDYADAKNTTGDITVEATIGTTVVNKYAVDLTYSVSDITINGKYVWNVNTLVYELGDGFAVLSDKDADDLVGKLSGTIDVGSCTVTNYSDMPVYVSAGASYANTKNVVGKIILDATTNTVAGTQANADLVGGNVGIADAYVENNGVKGTPMAANFTISLYSDNWANAANDLKAVADTGVVVATYTITISATDPSVAPVEP